MSNTTVGAVYQQIIRDVVDSSRVDFEEGGVDESVLDELSRVWQQKLTALNVAQFPWDPKPEAPPPQQQQTMANIPYPQEPTPAPMQQQQQQHAPPQQGQYMNRPGPPIPAQAPQFPQMPQMPQMNAGPRIKAEPGLETGGMPPVYTGMGNATTAQQRAAQNLQASYGARAAASINAIQGMPQQGQPQQQQGQPQQQQQQQPSPQQGQQQAQQQQMHQAQQRPQGPSIQRPQMTPSQYQQALAQQAAHQKQQLEQQAKARQQAAAQQQQQQGQGAPNGAQHAQTDGGADDEDEDRHRHFGVIKQIGGDGSEINMGRVELDGLIRRQIEARGKAMEGGGLMLPLKQHKGSNGGRRERKKAADVGQTDGGDDDDDDDDKVLKAEDDDEDAINSDLDDPDDPKSDDSGDDETPQVMLCMYDKVQRVKNKWKCVMKDGVLTINGKDYVFHKASGEYEW
ncbi:transcription factor IIA subunit alpha [Pseudogymnoascus verrucosus]|uniref:Transcription factor IIA subunit alpha n=1 Tax=Pseudogymnoascus verrucosus TaxID=342668 RepID=A0A2P2SWN6_9PEZI|nr:transcription factor IIA subunit alpha [Pseudogymnoascus verrucosus]OBU01268.1 transcription factor IIA subunit alpha [Pseudogymnoascus verrucosus]